MRPSRSLRLLLSALVVVLTTTLLIPSAASAATLTSASFTANSTQTGAQDTTYNYGFTTAGYSTSKQVSASVPTGTGTYNARYLALNNDSSNYASTPDSVANSVTGNLDIRAKVNASNWTNGSLQTILAKWNGGSASQESYWFGIANTTLRLYWNGTVDNFESQDSASLGFVNGSTHWVRVTFVPDNGSSGKTITFYTSTDGTSWSQVGSAITIGGTTAIVDGPQMLQIGANYGANSYAGKVYYADVRAGITGTTSSTSTCSGASVVSCFNPSDDSIGGTSWTSTSPQTEPWSIARTATALPADIASDVTATNVSGLPSGGTASYRTIDGAVVYVFPSTVIAASTPCTISFTGLNNTATAGSYSSTITNDNGDSGTTGTVVFTTPTTSVSASATIDSGFTFGVAGASMACNGESNFVTAAGSPTAIALAHVGAAGNVSGGQTLTVGSNVGGSGFSVYIRGTQATQNLRSSSRGWTDVAGTYASPVSLGSGEAFGYTYKDSTSSTAVTNPGAAKFVGLDNTNRAVMASSTSPNGSGCVSFDAQTSATTAAGSYSATVIYVAVPSF